jgi:hypothetical protein
VIAVAACTGNGDRATPTPTPTFDTPGRRADALRFGVIGAPATLDPYDPSASDLTYTLARPVYPSLFRFLPSGTPQRYLAASIRTERGGATVTLRRARWSDGRAITARDVVASAGRAAHPSGFAGLQVEALDARTVRFRGRESDWPERLSTLAFVLPRGRAGGVFGGPFTIKRNVRGYEVVLRRNDGYFGRRALLRDLRVRFVQDLDLMLLLLERGRLDAAAPPATLNLDQRLEEFDLSYEERSGWEGMWLDFRRSKLAGEARAALLGDIRFGTIQEGLVRDEGELELPGGLGDRGTVVRETIIGPNGDELLSLFMRAAWFRLTDEGHSIELLRVDPEVLYGEWKRAGPGGVAVRRAQGAPGLEDPLGAGAAALKAFTLHSFVTWTEGVIGLRTNPTTEGPLWKAEALDVR